MMRYSGFVIALLVAALSCSYGQITITYDEIPQQIGSCAHLESAMDVDVDVGTPGGGNTWDLTSYSMVDAWDWWIVDKGDTPFAGYFPSANLVDKISPSPDVYVYSYIEATPASMNILGTGMVSPLEDRVYVYDEPNIMPLPIAYGNQWRFYHTQSDTVLGGIVVEAEYVQNYNVDAWGTVQIPLGTFDCLRTISYDTVKTITYLMGTPMYGDTSTYISYVFWVEDYNNAAIITSHAGETNPSFTNASSFQRLESFTGIQEELTETCFKLYNYPDPIIKSTDIFFAVPCDGNVKIEIYNISGQKIETLVNGWQTKGQKSVEWDAEGLPGGIYLCRIETEDGVETNKMTVLH